MEEGLKWYSKNWLVHRIIRIHLTRVAAKYIAGRLLDIGCGEKPYKKLFAPFVSEHIGIDYKDTPHDISQIDRFGTAYTIPADNEEFDCVICTAVLEHLEEPEKALNECFRVLRPGGVAIYTVPFIWHLHEEPRDFFRYSKYGLKYLFKKAQFEILELKALSGFWVTFGQLFVYNIYRLNHGFLRYIPIIPAIGYIVQGVSYLLESVDKTEKWTWMYLVVAKKP